MNSERFEIAGLAFNLESGAIARRADGAVVLRHKETFILATVVAAPEQDAKDFFPLTVEYREKMAATGRIPGSFLRRELRPGDHETVTSRLIDRTLRPLIPKEFRAETQIQVTVHSAADGADLQGLSILAAGAALHLSDIPFNGPVASTRLLLNESGQSLFRSPVDDQNIRGDLIIAATPHGIVMVDGGGAEISEETLARCLTEVMEALEPAFEAVSKLQNQCGRAKRKMSVPAKTSSRSLELNDAISKALGLQNLRDRTQSLKDLRTQLAPNAHGDEHRVDANEFDQLVRSAIRKRILSGRRLDGREAKTVRPIECETDLLPRPHGSALFTRGHTQALVSTTIGVLRDAQDVETLGGMKRSRFLLHYNFPGFAVGDARSPRGGPGRREIGHGQLARRAILGALPDERDWPYTTRVVSDITESDGSSSMATVCGAALSLLAAGVPLKSAVAGVAMGLVNEGGQTIILSDITGEEDHFGDMDLKVAGTKSGITAIQLDNKLGRLDPVLLHEALLQARDARHHILERMRPAIEALNKPHRAEGRRHVSFLINPNRIGQVVGAGGKNLQGIQSRTKTRIELSKTGRALILGSNTTSVESARRAIEDIALELRKDGLYLATVSAVKEYGAFVRIASHEGLVHISECEDETLPDAFKQKNKMLVRVLGADPKGRIRLSEKAALGSARSDALNR